MDGKIYTSFSGGKDSTVLADLAARAYAADPDESSPLTLIFENTGLEYPEIQKFVKEFAEWLRLTYGIPVDLVTRTPEMTCPQVLSTYGYPVINQEFPVFTGCLVYSFPASCNFHPNHLY